MNQRCVSSVSSDRLRKGFLGRMSPGFSLLPVLLAVSVAVISAGVVVPEFRKSMAVMELQTESKLLASQLARARTLSISSGLPHAVVVDAAGGAIRVIDTSRPEVAIREQAITPGIKVTMEGSRIAFQTRGTASPATIWLQNNDSEKARLTVGAGGKTKVEYFSPGDDEFYLTEVGD